MKWPWQREKARDVEHEHGHHWEVIGAVYYKPRGEFEITGFVSNSMVEDLMYGTTVLTQKCTDCGYINTKRVTGKVSRPGFEWKDKVG